MLENDLDADMDEDAAADEILASVMDAEGIAQADRFGAVPMPGGAEHQTVGPQAVPMGADGPGAPPPPGGGGGGGGDGGGDSSLAELEARMDALRRQD